MNRRYLLNHIGNFVCICDDNFFCLFTSEIRKFFQHFFRRAQIQRSLIICIRKTISGHNDTAVNFILRIHKMHIAGCDNRFFKLIPQFDDFFIDLDQVFIGLNTVILFICQHKCIVSERLDFQIIVEIYKSCNLRFRCISKNCLIQFPCFTGTSDQKPVPVFQKQTLRYTRTTTVIFQMRLTHQLIQINSPCLISCQNDCMISRQFLDRVD